MAANGDGYSLVEESEEDMVTFLGSEEPIRRKGWFLKPISNSPSKSELAAQFASFHYKTSKCPKASFKGWVCTFRQWDLWVQKLKPIYQGLWKQVGIFDAINASTYKFRRDLSSLWGVIRFWCGETNTFLFPWAEATVTLEDVMILGGFSVLGDPVLVSGPLGGELGVLEAEMGKEVRKFNKTKCKKADFSAWLKYYSEEGDGGQMEHTAFLALWIARFVFSQHPMRTVGFYVIQMAVRLARGTRIAFAPAVLASLYRDLRRMKDYLVSSRSSTIPPLVVWGPLNILQLWVWERFLALRPEPVTLVSSDEPRAARWHDVGKKLDYLFVMSVMKSPDEIQWRPYVNSLENWRNPFYSGDDGRWVCSNEEVVDEGLKSFVACLTVCELVGLDCIEKYHPNRVARQFGLDQNIPSLVPRGSYLTWEVVWRNYDIIGKNIKFYVPPRFFEPDVTLEYAFWWKSVRRLLRRKREGKKRKKKSLALLCYKKKRVEGTDNMTLSNWLTQNDPTLCDWLTRKDTSLSNGLTQNDTTLSKCLTQKKDNRNISSMRRYEIPPGPLIDAKANQDFHAPTKSPEIIVDLRHSLRHSLESCETVKLDKDGLRNIQGKNGKVVSDPLLIEDREVVEEVKGTECGKSVFEPVVVAKPVENFVMDVEDFNIKEEAREIQRTNVRETEYEIVETATLEDNFIKEAVDFKNEALEELMASNGGESVCGIAETEKIEQNFIMEVEDVNAEDVGVLERTNGGESVCETLGIDRTQENFMMEVVAYKIKEVGHVEISNGGVSECEALEADKLDFFFEMEVERSTALQDRNPELEPEIGKLIKEIALIHARKESLPEVIYSRNSGESGPDESYSLYSGHS